MTWVSARVADNRSAKMANVSNPPEDPSEALQPPRGAGRRSKRFNNVMLVLIMTAITLLGAPLAALIMGAGVALPGTEQGPPDEARPGSESPVPGAPDAGPSGAPEQPGDAVVATFNVLGNSHTLATGKAPEMDAGPKRLRRAMRLLDEAGADVVGLQELQRPQAGELEEYAGGSWRLFHAKDDSENALAWRRTTWQLRTARTVDVPYFNGNLRPMPVVRLRHRETGVDVWFVNVHNPASTAQFPAQGEHRDAANAVERRLVRQLGADGDPVILLGDFNQRAEAFCYFTRGGLLQSASGDRRDAACSEPSYGGIDWIFGTRDLRFSGWAVRDDDEVGITSDHPLVTVNVILP